MLQYLTNPISWIAKIQDIINDFNNVKPLLGHYHLFSLLDVLQNQPLMSIHFSVTMCFTVFKVK